MPEEKKEEEKKEQEPDRNKKYSYDDVHELREEAKKERKRREEAEKIARDAEARLKDLDEKEKAAKQKELEQQGKFKEIAEAKDKVIAELNEKHRKQTVKSALKLKAIELGMTDPDGLAMIPQEEITKLTIDESGNVQGVDELIKGFKEKKPYLFEEKKVPPVNGSRPGGAGEAAKRIFKRSDIAAMDEKTYAENRELIFSAQKEGRIIEG